MFQIRETNASHRKPLHARADIHQKKSKSLDVDEPHLSVFGGESRHDGVKCDTDVIVARPQNGFQGLELCDVKMDADSGGQRIDEVANPIRCRTRLF